MPGSPLDPRAEGTNDPIRAGATLCTSAEHVVAILDPLIATGPRLDRSAQEPNSQEATEPLWDELDLPDLPDLGPAPIRVAPGLSETVADAHGNVGAPGIVDLLGPSPVAIDDLVRQSGLPIGVVHTTLLELEIAGRLERHGGNAVSLIAGN